MSILEICAILAVIIFGALAVYIILMLRELKRNLSRTDLIMGDLQKKLLDIDPFFNSLSNVGEMVEKESLRFKEKTVTTPHSSYDLLEWLILSVKIGEKFINRR